MLELFSCQTLHPGLRESRKSLDENLPSGPFGRVAVHSADRPLISPVSKLVITNKKPKVRALVAQKSLSSLYSLVLTPVAINQYFPFIDKR